MGQFRNRPVLIEAVHFEGVECAVGEVPTPNFGDETGDLAPDWVRAAMAKVAGDLGAIWVEQQGDGSHALRVGTLEGTYTASPGDWIIRGVKGELYPCKPDMFAASYVATSE